VLFAAFFGAGAAIEQIAPPLGLARGWDGLIRLILGMIAWLALLFACAALGLLHRAPVVGVAAAAAVFAFAIVWRNRTAHVVAVRQSIRELSTMKVAAIALAAPVIVLGALFFIALTPYVGWDDSVAHLTLPRIYLAHGGFRPVPFNVYSNWPLNPQLLYAFAMVVQDYILAKLVHLTFLALTVFAVYRLASAHSSPLGGGLAAMLLLANPVVLDEARFAYIDLAFAFFFFMAFVCALHHLVERRTLPLLFSGLCCAFVAGTKLTRAFAAPCVGVLVMVSRSRRIGGVRFAEPSETSHCGLPCLLRFWRCRGISAPLLHGESVLPLYERFGGPGWSSDLNRQFLDWQQSIGMGRRLVDYLLLPAASRSMAATITRISTADQSVVGAARAVQPDRHSVHTCSQAHLGMAAIAHHLGAHVAAVALSDSDAPFLAVAAGVALTRTFGR
jgi:hypothetical protein